MSQKCLGHADGTFGSDVMTNTRNFLFFRKVLAAAVAATKAPGPAMADEG